MQRTAFRETSQPVTFNGHGVWTADILVFDVHSIYVNVYIIWNGYAIDLFTWLCVTLSLARVACLNWSPIIRADDRQRQSTEPSLLHIHSH